RNGLTDLLNASGDCAAWDLRSCAKEGMRVPLTRTRVSGACVSFVRRCLLACLPDSRLQATRCTEEPPGHSRSSGFCVLAIRLLVSETALAARARAYRRKNHWNTSCCRSAVIRARASCTKTRARGCQLGEDFCDTAHNRVRGDRVNFSYRTKLDL